MNNQRILHRIITLRDDARTDRTFAQVTQMINEEFGLNLSRRAVAHRYERGRFSPQILMTTHMVPERYGCTTQLDITGNVLVIADTHLPFVHEDYLSFLLRVQDYYDCEHVVHIGDFVDLHAISHWDTDPDGMNAGTEHYLAQRRAEQWYDAFETVHVCIGNHDARPYRKATSSGISQAYIRTHEEVWGAPSTWKWGLSWEIDGVIYEHGIGSSGKNAALLRAIDAGGSLVMGHTHKYAGIQWQTTTHQRYFGMNVGCGLDSEQYAFAYAINTRKRPDLGCGVVLENGMLPLYIPLNVL